MAQPTTGPMIYGRIPGVPTPGMRLLLGTVSFSPARHAAAHAVLDAFVARGGNAIETARSYGGGHTERVVRAWLARSGRREEVVIVSKCCREEVLGRDLRVTPAAITADLAASREALGVDVIDVYLLHTDDAHQPVGPLLETFNEHLHAGRIRAFGASNWPVARLQEAEDYARAHRLVPFAVSSLNVSLAVWNEPPWPGCLAASAEDRAWYTERQMPVIAWSSQAQGFFTGRYAPPVRSSAEMVRAGDNELTVARLARARALGERQGVSANAIALAYVLCQPFPTFPTIGPLTPEELHDSATALSIQLTPDELSWLNGGA